MATDIRQTNGTLARMIDAPMRQSQEWSVDEAYRYCERLTRAHYENFPVGSVLVPKRLRKYFYSIYAFARIADDFADECHGETIYGEGERLALLDRWRAMLREAFAARAEHPVFVALTDTRAAFDLPVSLFEDLLSAFRQDVTKRRYATFDEVLDYCRRSADPIGRLLLRLFGYADEERQRQSDCICTALQLTNHWQDVAVDLHKDRVYLPEEDLRRFGVSVEALTAGQLTPAFQELMKFEVSRARELFARGKPLCTSLRGRLGLELRVVWLGGVTILDAIEANHYDVFRRRPVITKRDKAKMLWTAVRKEAFKRY